MPLPGGVSAPWPPLSWPCFPAAAAGNAFCQAAQLHLQLQSKHDAATCFVDAGNAFKKADPQGEPQPSVAAIPGESGRGRCGAAVAAKQHLGVGGGRHSDPTQPGQAGLGGWKICSVV